MNNETCVVTIADIYGAEWWERNKAELDREWEWSFGCVGPAASYADCFARGIFVHSGDGILKFPRIILHRRKPKHPTLREVYGVGEVTIPTGWEWTGEFRNPLYGDSSLDPGILSPVSKWNQTHPYPNHPPRLILRERPKKVWFKCEAEPRIPRNGDWFYSYGAWCKSEQGGDGIYLCATRHEEIDQTVQVVTQEDVDKCKS